MLCSGDSISAEPSLAEPGDKDDGSISDKLTERYRGLSALEMGRCPECSTIKSEGVVGLLFGEMEYTSSDGTDARLKSTW